MKKIYVLSLIIACAMGVRADEVCEVVGVGDFEDVLTVQTTNDFTTTGKVTFEFKEDITQESYKVIKVVITPSASDNFSGIHNLDVESGIDFVSDYGSYAYGTSCKSGSEAIISVDEESLTYTIVLTMDLTSGTTFRGVITGICADEINIPDPVDPEEGIENVQGDKVQSTKVIRDGQLFIIRGDKTFNALGAETK